MCLCSLQGVIALQVHVKEISGAAKELFKVKFRQFTSFFRSARGAFNELLV